MASNLTDLIKDPEVKKFLLENFPKPKINRLKPVNSLPTSDNTHPTLTGIAFEFFLRLIHLKNDQEFNDEFETDIKRVNQNSIKIKKTFSPNILFEKYIRINLSHKDYAKKIKRLKSILGNKIGLLKEFSTKFNFTKLDYVEDNAIFFKVQKKTKLDIASVLTVRAYFSPEEKNQISTIIVDVDSFYNYLDNANKEFQVRCSLFIKNKQLTKAIVLSILEFTQISSQFTESLDIVKDLHFEKKYIDYVFLLFSRLSLKKDFNYNNIFYHPSLRTNNILATPDFLLQNRILEIKTSKIFFSSNDYLQALAYLLLSRTKQNIKRWGEIEGIEIFYPAFTDSIEILIPPKEKISHSLKFLNKYAIKLEKEKKNRLLNLIGK